MKPLSHYIKASRMRSLTFVNQRKGWTTDRKIIVIESDDWGSIRMPSLETLNKLLSKNVKLNPERGLDRYDTLASSQDLSFLFEILSSVKDKNGQFAKITFNTVMANPDFNKIKKSCYSEYFFELFTDTLKNYYPNDNVFELWKDGIRNNVMKPQFHAREHLNVMLWLKALKENYEGVREGFNEKVFCMNFKENSETRTRFLEAYNYNNENELNFILSSITEGLDLFEKIFGFKSFTSIAPNYYWDAKIEEQLKDNGVAVLQGSFIQRLSNGNGRFNSHFMGEKNIFDQIYLTRNCFFEPSHSQNMDGDACFRDVQRAFNKNKPAIICSHRVNFIGELDKTNRDGNLRQFKKLLNNIVLKYPNVEFMTSDELGKVIL